MQELIAVTKASLREAVDAALEERGATLEERGASLENPAVSLTDVEAWTEMFGAWQSAAGVAVSVDRALSVPAVWAAVNFLSSTIASLPLHVYRMRDGQRELAETLPVYSVLHDDVNPEMSSFDWRRLAMQSVLTNGRAYGFIERNRLGQVMNIWHLDAEKMSIEKRQGRTRYIYREGGADKVFEAAEIIDIHWMLHSNGTQHRRPVDQLRNALGLAIALEEYAATFFNKGGVPPLQLTGTATSPAAIERAGIDVEEALKAARKKGRNILVMPFMHELKSIGIDPEKGQLMLARRFQLEEIARIYQLPPVFLQDLTKATLSNTEQQDLHFVKHTLVHWIRAWEQQLNLKLFGPRNRKRFVKFNLDSLLRGDLRSRIEAYSRGIQNAIWTPDEVRTLEDRPAMGGDAGRLHIQGATVPLGEQSRAGAAPPADNDNGDDPAEPGDPAQNQGESENDDDTA